MMGKRDLIAKDFALYVVHYFASMQTWSKEEILAEIDRKIKEADEAVIRCKDCQHYIDGCCYVTNRKPFSYDVNIHSRKGNDFCSYGERKEATP